MSICASRLWFERGIYLPKAMSTFIFQFKHLYMFNSIVRHKRTSPYRCIGGGENDSEIEADQARTWRLIIHTLSFSFVLRRKETLLLLVDVDEEIVVCLELWKKKHQRKKRRICTFFFLAKKARKFQCDNIRRWFPCCQLNVHVRQTNSWMPILSFGTTSRWRSNQWLMSDRTSLLYCFFFWL